MSFKSAILIVGMLLFSLAILSLPLDIGSAQECGYTIKECPAGTTGQKTACSNAVTESYACNPKQVCNNYPYLCNPTISCDKNKCSTVYSTCYGTNCYTTYDTCTRIRCGSCTPSEPVCTA